MSYNAPTWKVQNALKTYLDGKSISFEPTIYTGISNEKIVLPAVICQCQSARAEFANLTGNWVASCVVMVKENAHDTSEETHFAHMAEVFDHIMTDTIAVDLSSAASDFTCQLVVPTAQSYDIEDMSWVARIEFDAHVIARG